MNNKTSVPAGMLSAPQTQRVVYHCAHLVCVSCGEQSLDICFHFKNIFCLFFFFVATYKSGNLKLYDFDHMLNSTVSIENLRWERFTDKKYGVIPY